MQSNIYIYIYIYQYIVYIYIYILIYIKTLLRHYLKNLSWYRHLLLSIPHTINLEKLWAFLIKFHKTFSNFSRLEIQGKRNGKFFKKKC